MCFSFYKSLIKIKNLKELILFQNVKVSKQRVKSNIPTDLFKVKSIIKCAINYVIT